MLLLVNYIFFSSLDKPNAPRLRGTRCNYRDTTINWEPMGDNRAPILRYRIEFNTSFTPDTWEIAYDNVPATDQTYTVGKLFILTLLVSRIIY